MTREEAIESLRMANVVPIKREACDMAIKVLKQEPCGKDINVSTTDAISRQAVLEVIRKCHCEEWVKAEVGASIEALLSVTPAEKVSSSENPNKWIGAEVLDKIRAEIDQKQYDFMADGDYNEGVRFGLMLAYQIIGHYKAESVEVTE